MPAVHKPKPVYTLVPTKPTPAAFQAQASGTVQQGSTGSGLSQVILTLTIQGQPLSALNITLAGQPAENGSLQISSSNVTLGPSSNPGLYSGTITQVQGTNISANVAGADGTTLSVNTVLQVNPGNTVAGTVAVAPVTTAAPAPAPTTTPQTSPAQAPGYVPAPVTTAVS